ncbi:MAG: hypothetical protein L0Y44_05880 [Phycisphaerales bacterium]|nr:hypothetical protein [Phycisphaerales bacterium]MCI0630168.1 hypothetical protein [Phycisphaerales bacterium]MCI0674360.1 hypothetical protein [Phycisphaerales bacterium]
MTNSDQIDPLEDAREAERRESVVDRRSGLDRRREGNFEPGVDPLENTQTEAFDGEGRLVQNLTTNLERRRGPGRRRTDFMKAAEEGEMTQEQFMFVMAIDAFKRVNGRTFPTWTEVLEVIRKLGYRKTSVSQLTLGRHVEDWTEPADAPAGVFKQTQQE